MKITSIDRSSCRLLSQEAVAALSAVAEKYGLTVKYNGGNFSPNNAVLKLEFDTVGTDGVANSRLADAFTHNAKYIGLNPTDLGRTFKSNGYTFTVSGFNPRARKSPVLATRSDGKVYRFEADIVALKLKAA